MKEYVIYYFFSVLCYSSPKKLAAIVSATDALAGVHDHLETFLPRTVRHCSSVYQTSSVLHPLPLTLFQGLRATMMMAFFVSWLMTFCDCGHTPPHTHQATSARKIPEYLSVKERQHLCKNSSGRALLRPWWDHSESGSTQLFKRC